MFGAILGDIIGSPYEFDMGDKTKVFPLFSRHSKYTDDSVMTLAVAEALMDAQPEEPDEAICKRLVASMQKYGRAFPKAGYGYGETLHLTGPIELTNASGIICHDDEGNVNLHVHLDMSDRTGGGHGGHLAEGTKVLLTVDAVVAEVEGVDMGRKMDPDLEVPILTPTQL